MKILMLTDVFFPDTIGGAGRVAYNLCLNLSKKGHKIHVITRNTGGQFPSHEQLHPDLNIHRFFVPNNESLELLLSEIKNSFILARKIAKKMKFDILCIHQSMAAIGPLMSFCFKNIQIVYYYHSPWHEEFMTKKRTGNKKSRIIDKAISCKMRLTEKYLLNKASKIIVLSRYMSNTLSEIHNISGLRIVKIPGGVDLNLFRLPDKNKEHSRQIFGLSHGKIIFFTVRNLVSRMGLENLIEAFSRSGILKKKALLLIGGRGVLEYRLRAMVNNLDLKDCVHFLGYIPDKDLPEYYQAADYFVLPTEKLEGFGLVILESLACGTPVLGTPIGAIPELIGSFDERLIFEGTDWKDIKEKLEDIIENPDGYQYEPAACRKFIEERFSWEKVADEFEKKILTVN